MSSPPKNPRGETENETQNNPAKMAMTDQGTIVGNADQPMKQDGLRHRFTHRFHQLGNRTHEIENDPRFVKVSKFIRSTAIAELPQSLKVLSQTRTPEPGIFCKDKTKGPEAVAHKEHMATYGR